MHVAASLSDRHIHENAVKRVLKGSWSKENTTLSNSFELDCVAPISYVD